MFTSAELAQHEAKLKQYREAHNKLSSAYLRLRFLIPGALDTPTAPSSEEVWATTERALKNLLERAAIHGEAQGG